MRIKETAECTEQKLKRSKRKSYSLSYFKGRTTQAKQYNKNR